MTSFEQISVCVYDTLFRKNCLSSTWYKSPCTQIESLVLILQKDEAPPHDANVVCEFMNI